MAHLARSPTIQHSDTCTGKKNCDDSRVTAWPPVGSKYDGGRESVSTSANYIAIKTTEERDMFEYSLSKGDESVRHSVLFE